MAELDKAVKTNVIFRKAQMTLNRKVGASFKHHGLTETQFGVLDRLYSKGDLRISDLLESLLATSGNMTVVLKNMEKKGWIHRRQCSQDKRAYYIGLTDRGRVLFEETLPEHLNSVREAMAIFTDDELDQLQALLKKFKEM
ncbi:MarR family winged helix-turn-helix transcriptional regulator [Streptococcus caprae]|uniref:MarR family winged helix-turn-helix transcriptional regulator n=1 Tax=Streptococcus caprae TaxID=1640501 RepID=A0ABV8CUG1_9STRE